MTQKTVGMSTIPAWKGIGTEPRMHHRDRTFNIGIHKFRIKKRYLLRQQHAFIHNSTMGKAADIEIVTSEEPCSIFNSLCNPTTDDIELSAEFLIRDGVFAFFDKKHLHHRLLRFCGVTK